MSNVDLLNSRVASAFFGAFPKLRPAQEDAIEPLIRGQNVIISSGTGSGKTEAVMAPLVNRYWQRFFQEDTLILLYIAPTKALVNDLHKRLSEPIRLLGMRAGVRHGDKDDLSSGQTPHILITTPESLDVLLFRKDAALSSVRAVILDEVHLLYNTQRGLQLSILLQRLKQRTESKMQWAALSATISELTDIKRFIFKQSEDVVLINYPSERSIDGKIRFVASESDFFHLIQHITANQSTKLLIFANSRRECERLTTVLRQDSKTQDQVLAHYSSLSQDVRLETEKRFAALPSAICVATSTLELGIDIGDIDAVLLWGVPAGIESFLQRIGRGNRRTKKTNVICLIPNDSDQVILDALYFVTQISEAKAGRLPSRSPYELFGVFGQQSLSMIASDNGRFTRITDLMTVFEHKDYLTRDTFEAILSELSLEGYLKPHGFKNQYGADNKLYKLVDHRMIYGNFPRGSQKVEVHHKSRILGTVPAENILHIKNGDTVRFIGNPWKVVGASYDGIMLIPTNSGAGAKDFRYFGVGIEPEPYLADRMWQLIHSENFPSDLLAPHLRQPIIYFVNILRESSTKNQIPVVKTEEGLRYLTFAGSLINRAIALATEQVEFEVDNISILVHIPIDWRTIPNDLEGFHSILPQLFDDQREQSIYQDLLPKDLQIREVVQEWLKDNTIIEVLERLSNSEPITVNPKLETMLFTPLPSVGIN